LSGTKDIVVIVCELDTEFLLTELIQNNFVVQKAAPDLTINFCTLAKNQLFYMMIGPVNAAPYQIWIKSISSLGVPTLAKLMSNQKLFTLMNFWCGQRWSNQSSDFGL